MTRAQNTPGFWRIFYEIQEHLATGFLHKFTAGGNCGGIRNQSSLPLALNKEAAETALLLYKKKYRPGNIVLLHEGFEVMQVTKQLYDDHLAKLDKGLRQMIHQETDADQYFLVAKGDSVVAGYTANHSGYLFGLFTLTKGIGATVLELQIHQNTAILGMGNKIHTFCFQGPICGLLKAAGLRKTRTDSWDERLAPILWDGPRFGRPSVESYEL